MTVPVWPSDLYRPLQEGFDQARSDNRRMLSSDQGPPRPRRGWSKAIEIVSISIMCDRDQRATLERFFEEETESGTLPFSMPDPGTDGEPLLSDDGSEITDELDNPILITADWLCLFSTPPSMTTTGMYWRVRFDVAVLQ